MFPQDGTVHVKDIKGNRGICLSNQETQCVCLLRTTLADSVANFSGGSVVHPIKDWQLDFANGILVTRKRVACGEEADVEKCVGHGERKGKRPIENSSVCMGRVGAQSISTNVSGLHLGIAKISKLEIVWVPDICIPGNDHREVRYREWWMRVALDELTPEGEFDRNTEQMSAPRTTKSDRCGRHCAFHYAQEMLLRAERPREPSQWKE